MGPLLGGGWSAGAVAVAGTFETLGLALPESSSIAARDPGEAHSDASFELVISQQMLQFVPDRAAAVREIRRVLAPGGRVVVATWRSRTEQPLFETLGAIAERHLGPSTLDRRFALGDADELRALFADAGFCDIAVEVVSRVEHYASLPVSLAIAPMFDVSGLTEAERAARLAPIEAEGSAALKRFAVTDGIEAAARANFLVARIA